MIQIYSLAIVKMRKSDAVPAGDGPQHEGGALVGASVRRTMTPAKLPRSIWVRRGGPGERAALPGAVVEPRLATVRAVRHVPQTHEQARDHEKGALDEALTRAVNTGEPVGVAFSQHGGRVSHTLIGRPFVGGDSADKIVLAYPPRAVGEHTTQETIDRQIDFPHWRRLLVEPLAAPSNPKRADSDGLDIESAMLTGGMEVPGTYLLLGQQRHPDETGRSFGQTHELLRRARGSVSARGSDLERGLTQMTDRLRNRTGGDFEVVAYLVGSDTSEHADMLAHRIEQAAASGRPINITVDPRPYEGLAQAVKAGDSAQRPMVVGRESIPVGLAKDDFASLFPLTPLSDYDGEARRHLVRWSSHFPNLHDIPDERLWEIGGLYTDDEVVLPGRFQVDIEAVSDRVGVFGETDSGKTVLLMLYAVGLAAHGIPSWVWHPKANKQGDATPAENIARLAQNLGVETPVRELTPGDLTQILFGMDVLDHGDMDPATYYTEVVEWLTNAFYSTAGTGENTDSLMSIKKFVHKAVFGDDISKIATTTDPTKQRFMGYAERKGRDALTGLDLITGSDHMPGNFLELAQVIIEATEQPDYQGEAASFVKWFTGLVEVVSTSRAGLSLQGDTRMNILELFNGITNFQTDGLDDMGYALIFGGMLLEAKKHLMYSPDRLAMIVDEIGKILRPGSPLEAQMKDVAARWRSLGLDFIYADQRLGNVPKDVLGNTGTLMTFRVPEQDDLRTARTLLGIRPDPNGDEQIAAITHFMTRELAVYVKGMGMVEPAHAQVRYLDFSGTAQPLPADTLIIEDEEGLRLTFGETRMLDLLFYSPHIGADIRALAELELFNREVGLDTYMAVSPDLQARLQALQEDLADPRYMQYLVKKAAERSLSAHSSRVNTDAYLELTAKQGKTFGEFIARIRDGMHHAINGEAPDETPDREFVLPGYETIWAEAILTSWISNRSQDAIKIYSALVEGTPEEVQARWEQFQQAHARGELGAEIENVLGAPVPSNTEDAIIAFLQSISGGSEAAIPGLIEKFQQGLPRPVERTDEGTERDIAAELEELLGYPVPGETAMDMLNFLQLKRAPLDPLTFARQPFGRGYLLDALVGEIGIEEAIVNGDASELRERLEKRLTLFSFSDVSKDVLFDNIIAFVELEIERRNSSGANPTEALNRGIKEAVSEIGGILAALATANSGGQSAQALAQVLQSELSLMRQDLSRLAGTARSGQQGETSEAGITSLLEDNTEIESRRLNMIDTIARHVRTFGTGSEYGDRMIERISEDSQLVTLLARLGIVVPEPGTVNENTAQFSPLFSAENDDLYTLLPLFVDAPQLTEAIIAFHDNQSEETHGALEEAIDNEFPYVLKTIITNFFPDVNANGGSDNAK